MKQKLECQGKCRKWRKRQKCPEVRFCGGLPRSSVEVSVMGMERRGRHTQATGIIQLLNKEEDMMKEAKPFVHWQRGQTPRLCLCTKSWVWRAVWGETFTHGSVRGWGWNSLALLDPWLYCIKKHKYRQTFTFKWNVLCIFASTKHDNIWVKPNWRYPQRICHHTPELWQVNESWCKRWHDFGNRKHHWNW